VLNDAVLSLTGVQGCSEDKNGLCDLDTFVGAMKERIAEVDFKHDCTGNYTMPDPDLIVDGRYPRVQEWRGGEGDRHGSQHRFSS
jgi:hypothetical protein